MDSKIAAVVAHYHKEGEVPLDLYELVVELSGRCGEIVFVSTNINAAGKEMLRPYATVVSRPNFGYDFWSYKVGIETLKNRHDIDGLLILNSSIIVFEPKKLCSEFLDRIPVEPCLFGLTSNNEISPHVQSYWVYFNTKQLLESEAFNIWWRDMEPISDSKQVIKNLELGMSKYFNAVGYPQSSMFKASVDDAILGACRTIADNHYKINASSDAVSGNAFKLGLDLASRINPTSIYWDVILHRHGYIKEKQIKDVENRDFRMYGLVKYITEQDSIRMAKYTQILAARGINI